MPSAPLFMRRSLDLDGTISISTIHLYILHIHTVSIIVFRIVSVCLLQPRKSSSTPRRRVHRAIQAAKRSSPTTCTCRRHGRRTPAPATARSQATFDSRIRRRRRLNRCHRNRRRHSLRRRCATATATRSSRRLCCINITPRPRTDPPSLSPTMPPIRRHPHRTTLCAHPPPAWRHQPRLAGTATAQAWHRRPWRQLEPRCACSAVSPMRPDGEYKDLLRFPPAPH